MDENDEVMGIQQQTRLLARDRGIAIIYKDNVLVWDGDHATNTWDMVARYNPSDPEFFEKVGDLLSKTIGMIDNELKTGH